MRSGRQRAERRRAPTLAGTVVEIHGIRATVLLHEEHRRIRCRPLRDRTQLAIGDRVMIRESRHGAEVAELAPRERCLWRPIERGRRLMASHVDRVLIVGATVPEPRAGFFDRFLVAADAEDIPCLLILNKCDLPELGAARELMASYRDMGYPVIETSATCGVGLDALMAELRRGLSVFAGHSGVGKSSLLNRLVSSASLGVREVNPRTGKGRHMTSVATSHELGTAPDDDDAPDEDAAQANRFGLPWPEGGLLIDTPGFRAFGLYGLALSEIAYGFRDLRPFSARCRFRDCLHESEPECAVVSAAASGALSAARYRSYRRILASVREGEG